MREGNDGAVVEERCDQAIRREEGWGGGGSACDLTLG